LGEASEYPQSVKIVKQLMAEMAQLPKAAELIEQGWKQQSS
jgi:NADH:ubiquinone oxidoreductase subunit D